MNYFNYPYNNYFANQKQYQPLQPCPLSRPQLVCAAPRRSQTITYIPSPQQNAANQELLRDVTIAVMKQSNNKIEKVIADVADLKKAESPIEYILKAMSLLKKIFNG